MTDRVFNGWFYYWADDWINGANFCVKMPVLLDDCVPVGLVQSWLRTRVELRQERLDFLSTVRHGKRAVT